MRVRVSGEPGPYHTDRLADIGAAPSIGTVADSFDKGGVEGEIGRFRRNFLVPVPNVSSLAELNEVVARADEADDQRHVDGRKLSVAEHFALERPHLRTLPTERFATEVDLVCRLDTKSRICVRQNFYAVPASYTGRRIRVLLGANQVCAYDGTTLLATHEQSPGRGREVLELDHYLEVLKIKAGALVGSSALSAARRCARFSPTHDRIWAEARRSLETASLSVLEDPSLAAFDRGVPAIAHYDQLLALR